MDLNLPWIEKYRPDDLNDLVSHNENINTLQKFISKGRLPHLLFYGPPGTGKTSTILAIAKYIYPGKEFKSMVLELNSSDDRGIGVVRSEILNFASTITLFANKFKLVILDEADAMTKDAQNALRRIIEKYTETTRFCLICNYQNKIIPALQSRCTRFRFSPLKENDIRPRLDYIATQEKLNMTTDGMDALLQLSNGDMRQAINVLQSTALAFDVINEDNVYLCVGQPQPKDMMNILNVLLNDDLSTAITKVEELRLRKGVALSDVISEVHKLMLKVEFPDPVMIELMINLSDIAKRLARGCSEKLQTGALVSTFFLVRDKIGEAAK